MTRLRIGLLALAACAAAACARAFPPSGGQEDRQPPRVLSTTPAAYAIVPSSDEKAVFRFDETLSERGFSEALVTVSPLDGALRVERSGNEIKIGIDGGWRDGRVYRIVILPGIRDRFANERKDAVELVFSTGPPVQESAVAGIVMDRISGRAAQNAVVTAIRRADSAVYMAVGDTGGFYSLRNIPLGTYDMYAYADGNRNRRRDPTESSDPLSHAITVSGDTLTQMFNVLPIDTTRPRLTRAEVIDTMNIRVTIDDWIDVNTSLATVGAVVHLLPDSTRYAGGFVMTTALYDRERAAQQPVDSAGRGRGAPLPRAGGRGQAGAPVAGATHDFIIRLDVPLRPGEYTVTVDSLPNIQGIKGGGLTRFQVRAPANPGPARPDTGSTPVRRP